MWISARWAYRGRGANLLVVQQLFSRLGGVFGIRGLDDGINGAALLAETAVDALCHINVVTRCSPASVLALFGFDRNGLGGADLGVHQYESCRYLQKKTERTASHNLHAIQRSSPVGYLRKACSPRNGVILGPWSASVSANLPQTLFNQQTFSNG